MPEDNRDYEKLKKEAEAFKVRYQKARMAAIDAQKRIALTEGTKSMRLYRKLLSVRHLEDPFTSLRQVIPQTENGLTAYIDSVSYKRETTVLNMTGLSGIVPCWSNVL